MIDVTLRPAVAEHSLAMVAIHHRCWRDAFGDHPAADDDVAEQIRRRNVDRFAAWLHPDTEDDVVVARLGDTIVGYATVTRHLLVHLFVDPAHARLGIGRTLLDDAERRIAAGGHPIAELHVRLGNDAAIGLYRSAGWSMTDIVLPEHHDGVPYDEHVMIKRL